MDINSIASIADNFNNYRNNDNKLITALNAISKDQIKKQFESYKERDSIEEKVVKIRYKLLEHLTVNSIDENTLNSIKETVAKEYPGTNILQNWKNFGLCYKLIYSEYEDDVYQSLEKLINEVIEKLSLSDVVKYRIVDFNGPQNNGNDEVWFAIYNKNHDTQKTAFQLFCSIKGNEDIRFGLYKHTTSKNNLLTIKSRDLTIDVLIAEFKKHIDAIRNDIPLQDDKNYWLFQANPKIYDLQSFLQNNHSSISFSVNQSKKQISKNDIVYFWISGKQGGIFAKGKIYDGPSILPEFDYEVAYNRDNSQGDNNDALRTYINITNNFVNEPLARDEIKQDSILAQLEVLRFANATNYRITPEQAARIDELLNLESQGDQIMKKSRESLNTILYGPPGTGKTYNAINKAVEIIDGKCSEVREEVVKRYNELKEAGQIDFITFHQSFSYEEFIEGIKPLKGEESNQIVYEIEDGILKSISDNASSKKIIHGYNFDENKINFYKMSLGNTLKDEADIFNYCIANNVIGLGYGRDIDFTNINNYEDIKNSILSTYKDSKKFEWQSVDRFKNSVKKNDIIVISHGNSKIKAIAKVDDDYYYDDEAPIHYFQYRKVQWLYSGGVIPIEKISKKQLSQQTIYQLKKTDLKMDALKALLNNEEYSDESLPFVLIIDEINRGNISKIFGELITLIEEDKRLGAENELTVTLPYSKEKFGVPSNLYIVGTMNTADRSIALMDTALRRRFTFEEMMPDLTTLDDLNINGIDIKAMLSKINERIEFLYDRDHTIGHAYFINLAKLEEDEQYPALCGIFSTKIIPLLQEYFYEDWEKIQLVLGDHYKQLKGGEKDTSSFEDEINRTRFIQSRLFSEKAVLGFDHEDYEDRVTYSVNPELNGCCIDAEAFLKIYKPKPDNSGA